MRVRILVLFLALLPFIPSADAGSHSASVTVHVTATIVSSIEMGMITNDPDDPDDDEVYWSSTSPDATPGMLVYTCPDGEEYIIQLPENGVRYAMRDFTFTQEQLAEMVDHPKEDALVLAQRSKGPAPEFFHPFQDRGIDRGVADYLFATFVGIPHPGI